ncbi:MAG: hypothetical protein JNK46_17500 [Methylobacteriaceae bacterium]|nr:hypothetical protein [Methylobacteriaceae bacterium]
MPHCLSLSRRLAAPAAASLLAVVLSGCGHVPLTTMARLSGFDPGEVDPAQLRVAIRAPDWMEPRSGEAMLKFTLGRRSGAAVREERFALEPAESPQETARLAAHRRAGERVWPWRVTAADVTRIRALQEEARRLRATDPSLDRLTFGAAIEACRRGEAPSGPIRTTTFLQPDAATGYLTLLDGVDLRETARKAGVDLDDKLPPCGKAALRAG